MTAPLSGTRQRFRHELARPTPLATQRQSHQPVAATIRNEPPTLTVPPTFAEVRAELSDTLRQLRQTLQGQAFSQTGCAAPLSNIERRAAWLSPHNSKESKYDMRQSLFALRQSVEKSSPGPPALALRAAFESVRAVCLDNSWECALRTPTEPAPLAPRPRMRAVPNFQWVDKHLLRGGEPTQEGVRWLVGPGEVRTVIDLTVAATDAPWAPSRWENVRVYHVPVKDYSAPTFEQLVQIVNLLDEASAQGNVFVHCKAGIGRTGAVIACWRITHGWSVKDAIAAEALTSYDASFAQEQAVRDFAARWRERSVFTKD